MRTSFVYPGDLCSFTRRPAGGAAALRKLVPLYEGSGSEAAKRGRGRAASFEIEFARMFLKFSFISMENGRLVENISLVREQLPS